MICYNVCVTSARSTSARPIMYPRCPAPSNSPGMLHTFQWSYLHTGILPRLKSCVCHSYENYRGVHPFFPFWNSSLAPHDPPLITLCFQPLANCPNCKSFVLTFIQQCRGWVYYPPLFPSTNNQPSDILSGEGRDRRQVARLTYISGVGERIQFGVKWSYMSGETRPREVG